MGKLALFNFGGPPSCYITVVVFTMGPKPVTPAGVSRPVELASKGVIEQNPTADMVGFPSFQLALVGKDWQLIDGMTVLSKGRS